MKQLFRILLLSAIGLYLCSCSNLKELQVTGVKGFKVNQVNTKGIDADVLLAIRNPNRFSFSIYRSVFDVKYSGIYLGKAYLVRKVKIRGNTEETYAFNLKGDLSNVNLLDVMKLLNGASFKNVIEVKGDLRAGKFLIKRKLPVDLKESIRLN